ncbi:MAG: FeoB-associated Cys-rich membrane protein [Clostridium sp.]|uniref:FeoB-associated Cys-rich membrane protein n=1 Tax=Clostridium sp. TaxID=1506 RepID=UPI002FC99043
MIEIIITLLIVGFAGFILYKKIGTKTGGCDCGSCTSKCPNFVTKVDNKIDDK